MSDLKFSASDERGVGAQWTAQEQEFDTRRGKWGSALADLPRRNEGDK